MKPSDLEPPHAAGYLQAPLALRVPLRARPSPAWQRFKVWRIGFKGTRGEPVKEALSLGLDAGLEPTIRFGDAGYGQLVLRPSWPSIALLMGYRSNSLA